MDKLIVTLWITFGLYLMVLFAIFADLSLIFKGITFEVADKKLMDILFFGQS